ncbi:MAG: 30S ribosomal protein S13 [Propionibacteriaceae bacterium]|jgi:hypothetical protein|nr:30S ribosomal protein S13 [Propionibacteriaceae bacterium]
MPIPQLSAEQLQEARQAATAARRARAEFKSRIRRGELTFSQALEEAEKDPVLAHIRVFDFLMALPRVGEKKANELMETHRIARSRRIQGLGPRQVESLRSEFVH